MASLVRVVRNLTMAVLYPMLCTTSVVWKSHPTDWTQLTGGSVVSVFVLTVDFKVNQRWSLFAIADWKNICGNQFLFPGWKPFMSSLQHVFRMKYSSNSERKNRCWCHTTGCICFVWKKTATKRLPRDEDGHGLVLKSEVEPEEEQNMFGKMTKLILRISVFLSVYKCRWNVSWGFLRS